MQTKMSFKTFNAKTIHSSHRLKFASVEANQGTLNNPCVSQAAAKNWATGQIGADKLEKNRYYGFLWVKTPKNRNAKYHIYTNGVGTIQSTKKDGSFSPKDMKTISLGINKRFKNVPYNEEESESEEESEEEEEEEEEEDVEEDFEEDVEEDSEEDVEEDFEEDGRDFFQEDRYDDDDDDDDDDVDDWTVQRRREQEETIRQKQRDDKAAKRVLNAARQAARLKRMEDEAKEQKEISEGEAEWAQFEKEKRVELELYLKQLYDGYKNKGTDAYIRNINQSGIKKIKEEAEGFVVLKELSGVIKDFFNRPNGSYQPKYLSQKLETWFPGPGTTCLGSNKWDFYCSKWRELNVDYVRKFVHGCEQLYKFLYGDLDHLMHEDDEEDDEDDEEEETGEDCQELSIENAEIKERDVALKKQLLEEKLKNKDLTTTNKRWIEKMTQLKAQSDKLRQQRKENEELKLKLKSGISGE